MGIIMTMTTFCFFDDSLRYVIIIYKLYLYMPGYKYKILKYNVFLSAISYIRIIIIIIPCVLYKQHFRIPLYLWIMIQQKIKSR